jgi:NADP-dependent 3-hydroxy acid dehydrogenase YdfG
MERGTRGDRRCGRAGSGATSGIGKAAAIALARQGAQVLLVGRDQGRAEETASEIGSVSTAPPKVEIADFAA